MRHSLDEVQIAGTLLVALGLAVMAGWLLHVPALIQILPGYVAMVFNTALCFVLCGAALLTTSRIAQRLLAASIMALSCLVWAQDVFSTTLRIDDVFFTPWLDDPNPHRGRMAPQTAVCFILSGCVLLLQSSALRRWSSMASQILILLIGATGIVSLIGYSLRLELLYEWYRYTRMAVHTAAAFTLLAAALWIAWYRRSALAENYSEREDRRFNAIGAALIVLVAVAAGTAGFALLARHTEAIVRNTLTIQLKAQRDSIAGLLSEQDTYTQLVARLPRLQRIPSTPEDDARLMNLNDWSRSILGDHLASLIIRSVAGDRIGQAGKPWEEPVLKIPLGPHTWLLWKGTIRIRREAAVINTRTSTPLGSIVTEMEAPLIARLIEQMTTIGATADMRICSPIDEKQMQCLPTRLDPRPVAHAPRFLGDEELPMSRTFRGESGTAIFVNYRNHRSIGAYGPLGNTGLGIVVQQDTEDTYAPIRTPFQILLTFLSLLVGGTILLLRWQVAPLVRKALHAQTEAKANAARVAAVMNSVPDGILTIDMEGTVVSMNPAVKELFGYEETELVGKNVQLLMPTAMQLRHSDGLKQYRETGRTTLIGKRAVEVPAVRRDGREFTMQLALTEMQLSEQRYVVGIMRDATERIAAERKLNDTHTLLQTTLDNVVDAIVTTCEGGVIQAWNLGAERIFGFSEKEARYRNLRDLIAPAGRLLLNESIHEALSDSSTTVRHREFDGIHQSGRLFPIDIGMSAMTIDDERLLVHVIRDISERREVDRIKNEFVSAVSHELRTPLTSIAGSLGMLVSGAAGDLPPQARRLAEIANQNSERLTRLINDILDLEKASQGELTFDMRPQSLLAAVRQVVETNQPYALKFNVSLIMHAESKESDLCVNIDSVRFGQVLANVISNAIKFSPTDGVVTVRIETLDSTARVAVQDHGSGIPEEFRNRIFQRFAQADGSDTRSKGGTGLGLSIAKMLVEKMRGDIAYESSPQGTTFYISLPIHPGPIAQNPP